MRLGIVGSREFTNEKKVKLLLEKYRDHYAAANLTVVSGGCPKGADFLARKVALEMGLEYVEFPPKHRPHNSYCILPPEEYNQPYHVTNFFARNTQIAEHCEILVAFIVDWAPCRGTMDTVKKADRLGRKVFIYEDKRK